MSPEAHDRSIFVVAQFGRILLGMAVGGSLRNFVQWPFGPTVGVLVITFLSGYASLLASMSPYTTGRADAMNTGLYGFTFFLNLLVLLRPKPFAAVARWWNFLCFGAFGTLLYFFYILFRNAYVGPALSWLAFGSSADAWLIINWGFVGGGMLGVATLYLFQDSFLMYAVVDILCSWTLWNKWQLLQHTPFAEFQSTTSTIVYLALFGLGAVLNLGVIAFGEGRFGGLREPIGESKSSKKH
jgi:hypothetical protein